LAGNNIFIYKVLNGKCKTLMRMRQEVGLSNEFWEEPEENFEENQEKENRPYFIDWAKALCCCFK
jgi:hypothetical protein